MAFDTLFALFYLFFAWLVLLTIAASHMERDDREHGRDIRTDRKIPPTHDYINRRTR